MYCNIGLHITIGEKLSFVTAQDVTITKTLQKLTNTAIITLPRAFREAKGKRLLDFINVGDRVKIELGYNDILKTEFDGYITNIGAEIPTTLECEDEMFQLKRTQKINHTFSNATLKQILSFVAPGYQLDCMNMSFGKFMIENATAFEVLEGLKKFGVRCNFKENVLHAGTLIAFKSTNKHKFVYSKNIKGYSPIRKSSDLKYKTKEKRECLIKAISIQKGTSKKVLYEFGKPTNGERTLHAALNLNKRELQQWAEDYYKNIVFDGYEGVLDSWCFPQTTPGDTLELVDPNYPDKHRDGSFLIESVTIYADKTNGIKRANKISIKL